MWSMIVQRSLFQSDVYPRKFVHPSTQGVRGGLFPPAGVRGAVNPPRLGGSGGQQSPGEGSGAAPPKLKIDVKLPCKSLIISSQSSHSLGE